MPSFPSFEAEGFWENITKPPFLSLPPPSPVFQTAELKCQSFQFFSMEGTFGSSGVRKTLLVFLLSVKHGKPEVVWPEDRRPPRNISTEFLHTQPMRIVSHLFVCFLKSFPPCWMTGVVSFFLVANPAPQISWSRCARTSCLPVERPANFDKEKGRENQKTNSSGASSPHDPKD